MKMRTKGLIAAPLTAFNEDGSVNLQIIPVYAKMLYNNGLAGVFVNGTTAEGQFLTFKERQDIAKCWVDNAPRGLRVIIHVGYAEQKQSHALAGHAAAIGADAIGEIGPSVLEQDSVETLVDYIKKTADSVPGIPYYYYHMPTINKHYYPMIEMLQIADEVIPNLAGIKYTHNDIADYKKCLEFNNCKYDILFGRDEFLIDGLKAGAQSAVGSTYNILAALYHELLRSFSANDLQRAQNLQKISAETCRVLYESGDFIFALKTVLKSIGLDFGGKRHVQKGLSMKFMSNLKSTLKKTGAFNYLNKI